MNFVDKFPDWEARFDGYQRDDPVYKRIICRWQEDETRLHEFHACLDTRNGDLYIDCRKRKIFAKHLTLAFVRPIQTCIKTLWHLSIIGPLVVEINAYLKDEQSSEELVEHTFESLADIVRTPVYGVAMTVVHVAAVVLVCVAPNTLYSARALVGRLERRLLRVETILDAGKWRLSPCFSPVSNISNLEQDKVEAKLQRLARSNIRFRRDHRFLFDDCCKFLDPSGTYRSAAAPVA